MPTRKTPSKPRAKSTAVVPMRDGRNGGQLRTGGTNAGGPGRPPEAIRMRSRDLYERWLAWAETKVDDKKTPDETMMQIGNTAGRYGFGEMDKMPLSEVRSRLMDSITRITAAYAPDEAEKIIAIIRPAWDAA